MHAYYMYGETIPDDWRLTVDLSDTLLGITLDRPAPDGSGGYATLAETSVAIDALLARDDLEDNARYIFPLAIEAFDPLDAQAGTGAAGATGAAGSLPESAVRFEPYYNLQKRAFDQAKDHNLVLLEQRRPIPLHLFVPFSTGLSSFRDCSVGFMLPSQANAVCNLPVEAVNRFHHLDCWYRPAIAGPVKAQSGETCRYTVTAGFRGQETATPCRMTASASAGVLDTEDFLLEGSREITLNTAGVPSGSIITLSVNSRSGTPAFYTTRMVTVLVE